MFFSLQDVTVILNGHTLEGEQTIKGWSEDTNALTLPDAFEFASVRRDATRDMAAFSIGALFQKSYSQATFGTTASFVPKVSRPNTGSSLSS